jgi:hypothetical protein
LLSVKRSEPPTLECVFRQMLGAWPIERFPFRMRCLLLHAKARNKSRVITSCDAVCTWDGHVRSYLLGYDPLKITALCTKPGVRSNLCSMNGSSFYST